MNNDLQRTLPENFVSLILKDVIRLDNVTTDVIEAIEKMNAHPDELEGRIIWKVPYSNKSELVTRLNELNKLGFLFAGGPHGWPPSAIFIDFREKSLVKGGFKEVRWRGPSDWYVVEK